MINKILHLRRLIPIGMPAGPAANLAFATLKAFLDLDANKTILEGNPVIAKSVADRYKLLANSVLMPGGSNPTWDAMIIKNAAVITKLVTDAKISSPSNSVVTQAQQNLAANVANFNVTPINVVTGFTEDEIKKLTAAILNSNPVYIPPSSTFTPASTTNTTVTPSNLIFHSINDLTSISNQPLVHVRDDAGNIILINDTASNNQLLTIESISYTVPTNVLKNAIDTQFNYFKFPPRFDNVEVVAEIGLDDSLDEIDLISSRYTPSEASGRQDVVGRIPTLRAGLMIREGVDDELIAGNRLGYYNIENNFPSILNMQTILAGTPQFKPSKFVITPDLIKTGENIYFKIRIDHLMSGNGKAINRSETWEWWDDRYKSGYNYFVASLRKLNGPAGNGEEVMRTGNYNVNAYINTGVNLKGRLTSAINIIRSTRNTYTIYLKQYNNMLAAISNRTTNQQRAELFSLSTKVAQLKSLYESAVNVFINTQDKLSDQLQSIGDWSGENGVAGNQPTRAFWNSIDGYMREYYEMTYMIDIKSAKPYDEYWIETKCAANKNQIIKDSTFWQIVPLNKIENAL